MVDLTLFHPEGTTDHARYRHMDRLNSWTGFRSCRFLEWMGWYNLSVAKRLLGHYRFFQHFKEAFSQGKRDLPAAKAYILQYKAGHGIKFFLIRTRSLLDRIVTPRIYYGTVEIAALNHQLVSETTGILYDFLVEADDDFTSALRRAVQRISPPDNTPDAKTINLQLNINEDHYHVHQHNGQDSTLPATKEIQRGKESDIFSKHQVLILFDLLASSGKFDRLNLKNPNKHHAYADLLRAITGRTKETILGVLTDYSDNKLYDWHEQGGFDQLIRTLTNLLTYFEKAGFDSFVNVIENKIMELKNEKLVRDKKK